jgi:hypothetical protein
MPGMDGQFHKELSLIRNDRGGVIGVAVSGPVSWNGATSATISATISQGDVTFGGVTNVTDADHVWVLAAVAEGAGVLAEGPATGTAGAIVHGADGTIDTVTWSAPPTPLDGLTLS